MGNNKYFHGGKEFHSIKALAEYVGLNEKTLTARLRKGMPLKEACSAADLRCHYNQMDGVEKSIAQICKERQKDQNLIYNRLKYGYSLEDALNKPKKISRQGLPIIVNGILYDSIADATRKLNLTEKESTIRSRLRLGFSLDEAFEFDMADAGNGRKGVR